jgi:hypothetical protein
MVRPLAVQPGQKAKTSNAAMVLLFRRLFSGMDISMINSQGLMGRFWLG